MQYYGYFIEKKNIITYLFFPAACFSFLMSKVHICMEFQSTCGNRHPITSLKLLKEFCIGF